MAGRAGKTRMVDMVNDASAAPAGGTGQRVGWAGLACGLLALAVALLPSWVAPLYDPPTKPLHERAVDWVGQLRDEAAGVVGARPTPPPPQEAPNAWRDPRITLVALLLAFAALACGAVAFVRREHPRIVASAVALGAGAIASEHLVTAVMVLLVAVTAVVLAAWARRA